MKGMNTENRPHDSHEIEVLTFTCSHCGGHLIEEVVMMERNIGWIAVPDDPDYDWDDDLDDNVSPSWTVPSPESDRNRYRCAKCGAPLLDREGNSFWGHQRLIEWLRRKQNQEGTVQPLRKMIKFTCPDCGGNVLGEVVTNLRHWGRVKAIFEDGEIMTGEFSDLDGSGDHHFECWDCGYELEGDDGPVSDHEELVEWLLGHCRDHVDDAGEKDHHEREG
jgi:predicted RNA-binding Zn-ribbon protein involved in translation (DUF1610 family)